MHKLILVLLFSMFFISCYAQNKSEENEQKIKHSIKSFLKWYNEKGNHLGNSNLIKGYNTDSIKTGDSLVRIDMNEVAIYLNNLKKSSYVSSSFLNSLKDIYQNVSDSLIKYPLKNYFGSIGGLEADPIFGFEPEEILDHIDEGEFNKIYVIFDKAIVKFDITKINQYIFTLTKVNNEWLIDYFGVDRTNVDKILNNH